MSSDLVAFLRARLDETEQRAHLALQVIGGRWDSWEIVAQQLHACCNTVPGIGRAGQHLHHNADPRKVLADIAAKRRVIGEYEKALRSLMAAEPGTPPHHVMTGTVGTLRRMLQYMAATYSDPPTTARI